MASNQNTGLQGERREEAGIGAKISGAASSAMASGAQMANMAADKMKAMTGTLDCIDFLVKQHREADTLLEKTAKATDEGARRQLMEQVADALAAHMRLEEEIFYPEANAEGAFRELTLQHSMDEHDGAKRLIADLLGMSALDARFDGKLQALTRAIREHVQEEEQLLLPAVKKNVSESKRHSLGERMRDRHATLMQGHPRNDLVMSVQAMRG